MFYFQYTAASDIETDIDTNTHIPILFLLVGSYIALPNRAHQDAISRSIHELTNHKCGSMDRYVSLLSDILEL